MRQEGERSHLQTSAGDRIHHPDLTGELQGIVEHRRHCAADQPHRACQRGSRAQKDRRVRATTTVNRKWCSTVRVLVKPSRSASCVSARPRPDIARPIYATEPRTEKVDVKFYLSPFAMTIVHGWGGGTQVRGVKLCRLWSPGRRAACGCTRPGPRRCGLASLSAVSTHLGRISILSSA